MSLMKLKPQPSEIQNEFSKSLKKLIPREVLDSRGQHRGSLRSSARVAVGVTA